MKTSVLFTLVAALTLGVGAADRYVSPKGSDTDNDGLTADTPYATLAKGVAEVGAGGTVYLADGTNEVAATVVIGKNMKLASLSGNRAACAVDGKGLCRILVNEADSFTLADLTLQNGWTAEAAGGAAFLMTNAETLRVTNCVIRDCHVVHDATAAKTTVSGGGFSAICDKHSSIRDVVVENCSATVNGAITAYVFGGGLYVDGYATMADTLVRGCSVTNSSPHSDSGTFSAGGGGVYWKCERWMTGLVVSNCSVVATGAQLGGSRYMPAGGGVCLAKKLGGLIDSLVSGNTAPRAGGGIYSIGTGVVISNCTIRGNVLTYPLGGSTTTTGGAGICLPGGDARTIGCRIEENTTEGSLVACNGGGITISVADSALIADCLIRGNRTATGGGLRLTRTTGETVISNCVITENVAFNASSAILVEAAGTAELRDLIVTKNDQQGPNKREYYVLSVTGGQEGKLSLERIVVRNVLFADNTFAGGYNGGAYGVYACIATNLNDEGSILFDHCTFAGNATTHSKPTAFLNIADAMTSSNLYIRGCAFYDNTSGKGKCGLGGTYDAACVAENITHTLCDKVAAAFAVSAANHNVDASSLAAADLFVDAAGGNYRPTSTSALVDAGGPFEDWMGTGRRGSVGDAGNGSYRLVARGAYGVSIVRDGVDVRRSGKSSDIGCCEHHSRPGVLLYLR